MPSYRLGIDIGGTFTDFTLVDEDTGVLRGVKVPSVPRAPHEGIFEGLASLLGEHGLAPDSIRSFVHGTTIGVNTLLERSGARCGMLVTEGFRDILLIQRLRLPSQDYNAERPVPLIPRRHVVEVRERLRADGSVDTPLDEEAVWSAIAAARAAGLEALAICFLHSYRNPVHEHRAREIVHAAAPELYVACSADVWPQMREYERAVATVITTYVRPRVSSYLDALAQGLLARGVTARPYITTSNGGVMTATAAKEATAQTLLSGPASGAIGAAHVAGQAGFQDLITFDLGGTSADIAVVQAGRVRHSNEAHVAEFPVVMPAVEVSSIGAGGGSLIWIDPVGVLKVGPRSAGADPGPACYGRGGKAPTLTDAFLACGLINPEYFAGGRVPLYPALAEDALQEVAARVGLGVRETAWGAISVAIANTYAEFSNQIARMGLDPRDYTLVAFGGAGPLLGCLIADEFRMARVLVPLAPGTLCALGALCADVQNDYVSSLHVPLASARVSDLLAVAEELRRLALGWVKSEGEFRRDPHVRLSADLRYVGQAYEVELSIEERWLRGQDLAALAEAFHDAHQRSFAHADRGAPVELINLRLRVVGETAKPPLQRLSDAGTGQPATAGTRTIFTARGPEAAGIYRRHTLRPGHRFAGPAIVEQDDTTTFIPVGFVATVEPFGSMVLQRGT